MLAVATLQDWRVEFRRRLSGQAEGDLYKAYQRVSTGKYYWTLTLWLMCLNPLFLVV